jgi:hypothetical protein
MRSRLRLLPVLAAAVLSTAVLVATPAAAATGPGGSVGCAGVSCYADVWQYIHLSGTPGAFSYAAGDGNVVLPPPPCYMEPMFSGPELYLLYKEDSVLPGGSGFPFPAYVPQIKQDKASNAGYWWERVTNLGVGGTCGLPLLHWVVNGAAPPLPAVPAIDLAIYAYDHMTLPAPKLLLNPQTRSYVSLPTYVWAALPFVKAHVTASLGDEAATVFAAADSLQLTVSQGDASVSDTGCTPRGSTAVDPPPDAGPGTVPDCGVTFTAPSSGTTITGTNTWNAYTAGRGFQPITTRGYDQVPVDEIQSLNN